MVICLSHLFSVLEIVFHKGTEAVVEDVAEIVVEEDGAVGVEVTIGAGGELIFEADVEGFGVVGDGRRDAPDGVEVGEVFAAFHIYMITVGGWVEPEGLPCPEILHVAEEEVEL